MNCITLRVGVHQADGLDRLTVSLEEPPIGDGTDRDLPCAPDDPAFRLLGATGDEVRLAGERLYNGLAGHPDLCMAFGQAQGDAPGSRRPLYVWLRAGADAEQIPWETLCLPDGTFMGLDPRWSIARIVKPRVVDPGSRPFAPPLRVAVILSCWDIPADQEWAELEAAIRATPLAVELLVFAGEPTLITTIATSGLSVQVEGVPEPERVDELKRRIAAFRPHVVHFFCHGSTNQGPHLELASTADWVRGSADTSLFLEADAIGELTDQIERAWLVVLNCCEGAASGDQLHSLARNLVFDAGFPAVVGMREPILSADANSFSRVFFRSLFDAVQACMLSGGGELDWTSLLVDPRRTLVQRAGGVFKVTAQGRREWTLPVLYLRPDTFVLAPPAPVPATSHEVLLLELLQAMRAAATGPDTPPAYVADLDARIGALERRAGGG